MAVVLLAMGGYGAGYLGWAIRTSEDGDLVGKAKELHPKLSLGMFIFFALGASGGMLSLIMQVSLFACFRIARSRNSPTNTHTTYTNTQTPQNRASRSLRARTCGRACSA